MMGRARTFDQIEALTDRINIARLAVVGMAAEFAGDARLKGQASVIDLHLDAVMTDLLGLAHDLFDDKPEAQS